MLDYAKGIIKIQSIIHQKTGKRTDAHFKKGYGALFVPEYAELIPPNVIYVAPIMELKMRSL